ncbi:MAG: hypothetical protein ACETWB_02420 [Anaerolineae bacterium]
MKVKIGQLMLAAGTQQQPGALSKLMQVEGFCVRLAYRLAKLAKLLEDEIRPVHEARNKLIEKYGSVHKKLDAEGNETDKDEPGKSMRPDDEKWQDFVREHNELTDTEIELDIEPVVLPPEAEGVSPGTLLALDGLVTVRGEDDAPKSGPSKVVE